MDNSIKTEGTTHPIAPLVSIIVPAFNSERHLGECLSSLSDQTYKHIEVIVVDDGSTDSTHNVALSCQGKDSRIVVLTGPNQGVSAARNRGLHHARGEYVMFVDADDWIDRDVIELSIDYANAHSCAIVKWGVVLERDLIKQYRLISHPDCSIEGHALYKRMLGSLDASLFTSCGTLYAKNIFTEHGIRYPENMPNLEDIAVMSKVYSLNVPVYFPNRHGYHYRINPDSASQSFSPHLLYCVEQLSLTLATLEQEDPRLKKYRSARLSYCSIAYLTTLAQELYPSAPPLHQATPLRKRLESICRNPTLRSNLLEARACNSLPLSVAIARPLIMKNQTLRLHIYLWILNHARVIRRKIIR